MSFNLKKQAQTFCDNILTTLGDNWKGRVWNNNLGWHCAWQWGSVTLYYSVYNSSYSVLIGEPGGCGGHMDLSYNRENIYIYPKEAIQAACDVAIEVFEKEWAPIQQSVTEVRASLEN